MYLFKNKRWNKVVPFNNKQGGGGRIINHRNIRISYLYNRLVLNSFKLVKRVRLRNV